MSAAQPISGVVRADRTHRIAAIVRNTGRRLLRFIRTRVASDADADDILQDVWQQLVVSFEDGPIEQVGAWLYTVARNRIIDRYRKARPVSLDALAESAAVDDLSLDLAEFLPLEDPASLAEPWRELF